ILDRESGVSYILHTAADATDKYLLKAPTIEAELREKKLLADKSNALMRAIIDTAQAGIFLLTPVSDEQGKLVDFRFRMANKMIAAYVGQTPESIAGGL